MSESRSRSISNTSPTCDTTHNLAADGTKSSSITLVHVGAGYHAPKRVQMHIAAANNALAIGQSVLNSGGSANSAVVVAIMSMEDNPITNAGYGSNLTEDGVVKGDAIIVDDNGLSGAVSAMPYVRNHIQVANTVLDNASRKMSLGRIPPMFVAGDGAAEYFKALGGKLLPHEALIEPQALSRWRTWKKELDKTEKKSYKHKFKLRRRRSQATGDDAMNDEDLISDTVGAIAIDEHGRLACGSSSGGLGLKKSGRVGPAALMGVGAYVRPVSQCDPRSRKVAVIASGSGEYLAAAQVCTLLAERLYDETWRDVDGRLRPSDNFAQVIYNFIKQEFLTHPAVPNDAQLGVLAVVSDRESGVTVLQGHNSHSFITGYVVATDQSTTSVSRLQGTEQIAVSERLLIQPIG